MEKQVPMLERWAMDDGYQIIKEAPKTKIKAKRKFKKKRKKDNPVSKAL